MEKKFSPIQIATLRNVARLVYPIQEKVDVLNKKIADISEEIGKLQQQIDVWDKPIVDMFGYSTTDLVKKEKIGTRTTYVLRYPNVTPDNTATSEEAVEAHEEEVLQVPEEPEEAEGNVPEGYGGYGAEETSEPEEESPFENPQEEETETEPEGETQTPENEEEEVFY